MTKRTIETGLTFLFAPGAGAPSCSDWMRTFAGQLKRRGRVESFDYPYQLAGRRSPDKQRAVILPAENKIVAG